MNDRISHGIDNKVIETQYTNYHLLICKNWRKWVKAKSPLKLDLDPIFLSRQLVFQRTISCAKHRRESFYGSHRIFWCNSSTTRSHTWVPPVNTVRKSHNHTLSRHWYDYPRITFSRLTQGKYHQITRKNSAYWQINTPWLFSALVLFKFPDVQSHGRRTSTDPDEKQARVKVHLKFALA